MPEIETLYVLQTWFLRSMSLSQIYPKIPRIFQVIYSRVDPRNPFGKGQETYNLHDHFLDILNFFNRTGLWFRRVGIWHSSFGVDKRILWCPQLAKC